nr:transposase [Candidatus Paceibacterota bacterium]
TLDRVGEGRYFKNMQRRIVISPGESYHLYNRGVEKRKIFVTKRDHERFLKLLFLANGTAPLKFDRVKGIPLSEINRGTPLVAIGAYVLMPNHFHLLVHEVREGGISMFMEKLTTAYASYFNKLNDRVGSLFQGTYKADHADTDEYLKYLYSYIHLNPVKLIESKWRDKGIADLKGVRAFLEQYRYSSYSDYLGNKREEGIIIDREPFPDYFSSTSDFNTEINDWLTYPHRHVSRVTLDT